MVFLGESCLRLVIGGKMDFVEFLSVAKIARRIFLFCMNSDRLGSHAFSNLMPKGKPQKKGETQIGFRLFPFKIEICSPLFVDDFQGFTVAKNQDYQAFGVLFNSLPHDVNHFD